MQWLAERQREFGCAILDAAKPMPPGLVGPDGLPSLRRFSVYRNNVVVGLIEALKDAYPAVYRIAGAEFFMGLAHAYAVQNPPASSIMLEYGAGFPDFIAAFEPASSLPYLADVARLERAWTVAYHAPEASPINPAGLTALHPDDFLHVAFEVHPSLRIVRSRFPALTIWRMNADDAAPGVVDLGAGGEDVLIVRPAAEVEVRQLPPGGAEFVSKIVSGATVTDALRTAVHSADDFNLTANLAGLLQSGAFISWTIKTPLASECVT